MARLLPFAHAPPPTHHLSLVRWTAPGDPDRQMLPRSPLGLPDRFVCLLGHRVVKAGPDPASLTQSQHRKLPERRSRDLLPMCLGVYFTRGNSNSSAAIGLSTRPTALLHVCLFARKERPSYTTISCSCVAMTSLKLFGFFGVVGRCMQGDSL